MQINIESPYDTYITELIAAGHFQNAEQVIQIALNEKFQFDQWDERTISLIEEGLNDGTNGRVMDIPDNYKSTVIEAAKKRLLNNVPIPDYVKP